MGTFTLLAIRPARLILTWLRRSRRLRSAGLVTLNRRVVKTTGTARLAMIKVSDTARMGAVSMMTRSYCAVASASISCRPPLLKSSLGFGGTGPDSAKSKLNCSSLSTTSESLQSPTRTLLIPLCLRP